MSHPVFKRAQVVSCYLSMPSGELDTNVLVHSILNSGKTLFVPRVDRERGEMDMLRLHDEQDLSDLVSDHWGIREPDVFRDGRPRANAMDPGSPILDLIILPGLAFDHSRSRLGHGKGYYDKFLASYKAFVTGSSTGGDREGIKMPVLLGLALKPQLLDYPIPIEDHDWMVDGVISPESVVEEPLEYNDNF